MSPNVRSHELGDDDEQYNVLPVTVGDSDGHASGGLARS